MVPPPITERKSTTEPRLDSLDVRSMVEATSRTYRAAGTKRLARKLGVSRSYLYKQSELPPDLHPGETPESADRRGPGELIYHAVTQARKLGTSESEAAAVLIETCRQLGYDALRRVDFLGTVMEGAADAISSNSKVNSEIAAAVRDGVADPEERRRIAQEARHGIESYRVLIAACEDQTCAEVRQLARRG